MIKKKNIALGLFLSLVPCSLSDQCGKEGRKSKRISGGYYPNPSQYPWMVFLNVIENDKLEFCGGSLISDRLVITAKHCTRGDLPGEALIKIHDRRFNKNKVNVKKVFTHKTGENNDIAIIFLSEPVDLEDPGIGTVCLPESKNEEYIGERVKGMGWGMTGHSEWDPVLKTVDLEVDTYQEPYFLSTKVAKINGVYQDPCAGDSGGPLVHKKNGRWTIIGTVSGGGYNCKSGKVTGPAVYNKISEHLPWIKKIMKETEDGGPSSGSSSPRLQLWRTFTPGRKGSYHGPSWRLQRTIAPSWSPHIQRGARVGARVGPGLGSVFRPILGAAGVGAGIGAGVGAGVGADVGAGVGAEVRAGIESNLETSFDTCVNNSGIHFIAGVGAGAGVGVGAEVGAGIASNLETAGVGDGVRAGIGPNFKAGDGVGAGVGAGIGPNFEAGIYPHQRPRQYIAFPWLRGRGPSWGSHSPRLQSRRYFTPG